MYVPTKNTACKVYHHLQAASATKHSVGVYHANLTTSTKRLMYQEFSSSTSKLRCLVATVAFGKHVDFVTYYVYLLGMDIPDVDLVVVYGTPSN